MILADADSVAIVTAICGVITTCVTIAGAVFLAMLNAKQKLASLRVEEVKDRLVVTASRTDQKLESIAVKVEEVRHATNSLTDQLVTKTEKEALERGGREERERAEKRGNTK